MQNAQNKDKIPWGRFLLIFAAFILLSAVMGYFLQILFSRFEIPRNIEDWEIYFIILGITLLVNLSVVPLPIAISLIIAASTRWNPVLVALAGSLGASMGEFSSYLVGYFSSRIAKHKEVAGYTMAQRWIDRYGVWAIAFLSFQPVLPFEIGGFIAGLAKMSVGKFLPALWLGKFPKYLLIIYAAKEIIHLIPFFH
jgi:uncharacterized membrane protein YdjX (TVP38/TMEM64 family)